MTELDDDRRSGTMTVLALESDPAQAATIRHVVCDLVRARLTLVRSIADALHALHTQRLDLILLPMFVAPAEEAELLTFLRALPNSDHIETQITPALGLRDAPVARHGWRPWRARPTPIDSTSAAEHLFAERVSWSLQQRREQQQADRSRVRYDTSPVVPPPVEPVEAVTADSLAPTIDEDTDTNRALLLAAEGRIDCPDANRREHRRFSGHELPGLRSARLGSARINPGPLVSVLDVSAGGALIETEARLRPESEAVLELLGNLERTVVPFRVLRWHVSALSGPLRYRGACAFTRPLDLADLVQPSPVMITNDAPLECPEGPRVTEIAASDQPERRQHIRVDGPFDGCRRGVFDMPVIIHNLSESGCFVDSLHGVETGFQLTLGVQPTGEDWITMKGEVVRGSPGFGFAVRFVETPDAVRAGLARLVASRAE
jgi:PilZ domain